MKIFVISLRNATKRRTHIDNEFKKLNLNFSFFDAQFPSKQLYENIQKFLPNLAESNLSDTEKACLMSHYLLLKEFIDSGLDHFTVFEDDIILSKDSYHYLMESNWIEKLKLGKNFIIKLESFPKKITIKGKKHKVRNRYIFQLRESYVGAAGYIVSSHSAENIVNRIKELSPTEFLPIDEIMFNIFIIKEKMNIYQLNPAICIQERFQNKDNSLLGSSIERINNIDNIGKKKSILYRIKQELYRICKRRKKIKFL